MVQLTYVTSAVQYIYICNEQTNNNDSDSDSNNNDNNNSSNDIKV